MMADYHIHVLSHGEFEYKREWLNRFIDQACSRGIREIGFSEHDEFFAQVDLALFQQIKIERRSDITLKMGIEVDYMPGLEKNLIRLASIPELDYTIGSVHFIDGWAFDHPDFKDGYHNRDTDEIYARYTEILAQMAESGLFDIVGHLDLVKIWGHRPRRHNPEYYFEPVLNAVKASNMAVEINSAGLRKPVTEIYPAAALVKRMFEKNIPIVLGSDAHHPEQVGEGLKEACLLAMNAGYRSRVSFDRHQKTVQPID